VSDYCLTPVHIVISCYPILNVLTTSNNSVSDIAFKQKLIKYCNIQSETVGRKWEMIVFGGKLISLCLVDSIYMKYHELSRTTTRNKCLKYRIFRSVARNIRKV